MHSKGIQWTEIGRDQKKNTFGDESLAATENNFLHLQLCDTDGRDYSFRKCVSIDEFDQSTKIEICM